MSYKRSFILKLIEFFNVMSTAKNKKIEKHFSQKNLLYICVRMKYESFNASYGATQHVIYSHPHIIYFSFSHFSLFQKLPHDACDYIKKSFTSYRKKLYILYIYIDACNNRRWIDESSAQRILIHLFIYSCFLFFSFFRWNSFKK